MNEINAFESIGVAIISIITFLCGQKWIWPLIVKGYNWVKSREEKQIDVTEELHTIKMDSLEYYEKTFDTLLNQIQSLEIELNSYATELEKLRNTILRLNSKLYKKSMTIAQMQPLCCAREDCGMRIFCQNYIENIDDNGESNNS